MFRGLQFVGVRFNVLGTHAALGRGFFLMMSLPVAIIVNLFFFVFWIFVDAKKSLAPLFLICLGSVFLPRTYQFSKSGEEVDKKKAVEFKVINYNVFGFWVTQKHIREDDAKTDKMKDWLVEQDADILCMPEFTNEPSISSFRNIQYFKKAGYKYYNTLRGAKMKDNSSLHTLVIFSKYPIVNHKERAFEQQNGLMYVDVVVRKDTVRVIGGTSLFDVIEVENAGKSEGNCRYQTRD